ncbi:MAG TPA: 2-amino-4-hydroxy-6-hydroxymethyldihydropteridine diphosphokinase, partial [Candidatus Limnocylindrales bacterium]|nr:2-amino-4-hydroxy-6-hydroxymethyldihydropteridine diphosphokinase [Candidatus Limnocylindrales bacterium]
MLIGDRTVFFIAVSPVYETLPVGGPEQGPYLNACASVGTVLPPTLLMQKMLAVENRMERIRAEKWGPRNIDLDLLLYEEIVMCTPLLKLPHPRLHERDFVLVPLAHLIPEKVIPGIGRTVQSLLTEKKPTKS